MTCDVCGKGPFKSLRAVTGHRNWCAKHHDPLYNTRRLMALRADLVRVARDVGTPEGYGPPQLAYRRNGRFSEKCVMGWIGGYLPNGNPRLSWRKALGSLHLKVWGDLYHTNRERLSADLRRVALAIGRPHHIPSVAAYRKLGRWDPCTALSHFRVTTWGQVADALELKRNRKFAPAKLTAADAVAIRARHTSVKGAVKELAAEYGVSRQQIRRIAKYVNWRGTKEAAA